MLWGNSPICSRLPYRYAMCLSFFAAYFIISSPSRGEMFSHPPIISDPAVIATQSLAGEGTVFRQYERITLHNFRETWTKQNRLERERIVKILSLDGRGQR